MDHQNDGIVREIPSVMIGVKNDRFRMDSRRVKAASIQTASGSLS